MERPSSCKYNYTDFVNQYSIFIYLSSFITFWSNKKSVTLKVFSIFFGSFCLRDELQSQDCDIQNSFHLIESCIWLVGPRPRQMRTFTDVQNMTEYMSQSILLGFFTQQQFLKEFVQFGSSHNKLPIKKTSSGWRFNSTCSRNVEMPQNIKKTLLRQNSKEI